MFASVPSPVAEPLDLRAVGDPEAATVAAGGGKQ